MHAPVPKYHTAKMYEGNDAKLHKILTLMSDGGEWTFSQFSTWYQWVGFMGSWSGHDREKNLCLWQKYILAVQLITSVFVYK
jgi:hypothetical protein